MICPSARFENIPEKELGLLRFVSYNITAHYFDRNDTTEDERHKWHTRKTHVKEILGKLNPGIMCLQELSPDQANELAQHFENYTGLFLSQTPSEIETGLIVVGTDVSKWIGKNIGTPLIGIFVKNDDCVILESGRFWLNENPDDIPTNQDRAITDKGFGNMNTYRAVLWAKIEDRVNGKIFYVFNSHYPLSGTSETRYKCAQLEMQKIREITNGSQWISGGDRNLIPRDDTDEMNRNCVLQELTSTCNDITHFSGEHDGSGEHYGSSTTWLGFTYDKETRNVEPDEHKKKDRLDVVVSKIPTVRSFYHPVGFIDGKIVELDDYKNQEIMDKLNYERTFGSDHCLVGCDLKI